jgi:hypothetical protein
VIGGYKDLKRFEDAEDPKSVEKTDKSNKLKYFKIKLKVSTHER